MRRFSFILLTTWAIGIGFLVRALFLNVLPGLHFDEAWAANYSYRIFSEVGFWPVQAMSPYTHPESHYLTALFFKLFGVYLSADRFAGLSMSVTGLLMIGAALVRLGEKKAATIFALLVSVCAPMVLNERLAIELTTFHGLCLGIFLYGLSIRKSSAWGWPTILVSTLLGISSHILFIAPVLAAWGIWAGKNLTRENEPREDMRLRMGDQIWIALICVLALPILGEIYFGIPEKTKAASLLALDIVVWMITLFVPSFRKINRQFFAKIEKVILGIASLGCAVFGSYLVFFLEGHWSVLFTHGEISNPYLLFFTVPAFLVGFGYLGRQFWIQKNDLTPASFRSTFFRFSIYTLFLIGIMSTKPAPRYFEMGLILLWVNVSLVLSKVKMRQAVFFVALFQTMSLSELSLNYFLPAIRQQSKDRAYQFLFFKDNSSDSLPKQKLVEELGKEGCGPQQVSSPDPRLEEALQFLQIGDWPKAPDRVCPAQHISVVREREAEQFLSPGQIEKARSIREFFVVNE